MKLAANHHLDVRQPRLRVVTITTSSLRNGQLLDSCSKTRKHHVGRIYGTKQLSVMMGAIRATQMSIYGCQPLLASGIISLHAI